MEKKDALGEQEALFDDVVIPDETKSQELLNDTLCDQQNKSSKNVRNIQYTYTRNELLSIRDQLGSCSPPPDLPSMFCKNKPGNLFEIRDQEHKQKKERDWRNASRRETFFRERKSKESWIHYSNGQTNEMGRRPRKYCDPTFREEHFFSGSQRMTKEFEKKEIRDFQEERNSQNSASKETLKESTETSIVETSTTSSPIPGGNLPSSIDIDELFAPGNEHLKNPLSLGKEPIMATSLEGELQDSLNTQENASRGFSRWFGGQTSIEQIEIQKENTEKATQIDINSLFATAAKYQDQSQSHTHSDWQKTCSTPPLSSSNSNMSYQPNNMEALESASFINSLMKSQPIYSFPTQMETSKNPNIPSNEMNSQGPLSQDDNSTPISFQMMLNQVREYEQNQKRSPTPTLSSIPPSPELGDNPNHPSHSSDLSKWFGDSIYQSPLPPMPQNEKMLSVEEVEQLHLK